MRTHCDACSSPIDRDRAVLMCDEEGNLFHFCTDECASAAEILEPGRELARVEPPRR